MSPAREPGGVLATILATLAAIGVLGLATFREEEQRPEDRPALRRLAQEVEEGRAEVRGVWKEPSFLLASPPLLLDTFPEDVGGWSYADAIGAITSSPGLATESERARHGLAPSPGTTGVRLARPGSALVRTLDARPGQVLEFEFQLRNRPRGTGAAVAAPMRVSYVSLHRRIDVAELLEQRSLGSLLEDRERKILSYGSPPPLFSTSADPANATWQTLTSQVLTPTDSVQWLIVIESSSDANAWSDLGRCTVRPLSLRQCTRLGPLPNRLAEERDSTFHPQTGAYDPSNPEHHGLELLEASATGASASLPSALWRIDCLRETRTGFLLPAPATLEVDVDLPEGDCLVEIAFAVLHEVRDDWRARPLELRATIGDATLYEGTVDERSPTGWWERSVALRSAGPRKVTLEVSVEPGTEGGAPELLAVAAPIVRRRAPADPRPNVILVSLDTFRAERMSAEGYPRPTTPNLDELARRNWWYRRAYSTTSYTLPSHASMMTGQVPSRHGVTAPRAGRNLLSERRSELLARRFQEAGWCTAAFTGGNFVGAAYGFHLGFDRFSELDPLLTDGSTGWWSVTPVAGQLDFNLRHRDGHRLDEVLEWIRQHRDSRFFLFLHTFLVHEYEPSPAYRERFAPGIAEGDADTFLAFKGDKTRDARQLPATDLRIGSDLYDATLAEADAAIGRLVETLRRLDLWYDTALVVTSDHGESFVDHGLLGHGRMLTEELLRVPLVLHLPGEAEPRVIEEPVSLIDLAPTLLEIAGLDPLLDADGRSLLGPREDAEVVAELDLDRIDRQRALVSGSRKLLVRAEAEDDTGAQERWSESRLHDVVRDERETRDLGPIEGATRDALEVRLRSILDEARTKCARFPVESHDTTEEMRRLLEALGYSAEDAVSERSTESSGR